jgi:arabinogalactan oligomer / maltooligosaccharide transport system substrate-binding protein
MPTQPSHSIADSSGLRLCALVLAALALFAPAARADTELVVWHAYRAAEKSAIEKVAAAYNASHPGTKVTTLAVPYDAFADKISAAVPRGKGPDIFIYAQDRLGGWIEASNTVEPIDFFLDQATKDRFIPSTLEATTYRGTVYGLPVNYKVITLIYNKKLVTTPPKTSGELVTLAKKLTDVPAGKFGLAYAYNDYYYHAALQNAFGGRVFEAGSKPVINNPENVKGLDQLLAWIDAGILPAEPSSALIIALFNQGKAAMVFSGPWFLGEIASDIDWGLAMLPTIDAAGGKPMRPWMTVEGAYISAPSKHKDAAYDFIKYLTDGESAKIMALEGRQSPSNKNVYSDPKIANDPVLKAFKAQVDVAVPMPNLPEMTMVWSPVTTMIAGVAKKGVTPKAGLDKAQEQVAKDVAGLRKK